MEEKAHGLTYLDHAKMYKDTYNKNKHYQTQSLKPYQEDYQHVPSNVKNKQSQWKIAQEQIKPNANPLSKSEMEYLFWNRLIQLGWKKGEILKESSYQLMLVCPECEKAIISQQSHTISFDKARQLSDKAYIKSLFKEHKDKCKPIEYDENGDLVEDIPKATPFEPFVVGTMRLDTISNQVVIYNGTRWVPADATPATAEGMPISAEAEAILAKNMTNWLDEHLETDYK